MRASKRRSSKSAGARDPKPIPQRLYINVDHVATVRQARRGTEPDVVAAALLCEQAGADGITAHLREDRRHIQDDDVRRLMATVRSVFNFEMSFADDIVALAEELKPHQTTLVPERREEVTTEGGLDLSNPPPRYAAAIARLKSAGVRVSLFIDTDPAAVRRARELDVDAIELHTGAYANHPDDGGHLAALSDAARLAAELGLSVHAGHGLTVSNVGAVAAIPEIEELNIGHSIVSRSIFVGLEIAVREMRAAMEEARG
ncbi:MAG: pyridoxine 5'-phosphate synthase [Gemmatimonadota bacterium]|nr:pyridoxine 5'-phosphate synthase [Gemmatimonadota bacterium]